MVIAQEHLDAMLENIKIVIINVKNVKLDIIKIKLVKLLVL